MDITELESLVQKLRAWGIVEYENAGVKLKLGQLPVETNVRPSLEEQRKSVKRQQLEEENLLFGSAEGFIDIDRELANQRGAE